MTDSTRTWDALRLVAAFALLAVAAPAQGTAAEDDDDVVTVERAYLESMESRLERLESLFLSGGEDELGLMGLQERKLGGDTIDGLFHDPIAAASLGAGEDDSTGTDPRAFGTKFMPYYRHTKLKNDLEIDALVLFGLVRLDDELAITYEVPVAKQMDYSSVDAFKSGGGLPPGDGSGSSGGGVPSGDLESDGDSTGVGDSILRLMGKNADWRFESPFTDGGSGEVMWLFETTVPTATDDALGGEALIASPGFAIVADMPAEGSFVALMNFYDFDVWKDDGRDDVRRFRGRWFYMHPLTPPAFMAEQNPEIPDLGWLAGLYVLPEFQPVYDFESNEFSFWIGPEIGKVYDEGKIFYIKPGFGVDVDEDSERETTFEMGWRYFF